MKFVINTLEEVAEPLRTEYEARNGKFYLKTEGEYAPLVESNTKLAEFRDNNRALNTKTAELETKLKAFEGVDVAEYATLKTKVTELEKAGVKGTGDVTEQIKAAVAAAVGPLEAKVKEREISEAAAKAEAAQQRLETQLREAGTKVGIDDRAMSDYVGRGTRVFKIVDGKAVARNGEAPVFSKTKPAEELGMEEWATDLFGEAPHLFKPSRGGGSGGNNVGLPINNGPKKVISSDPLEFGRNLESIAKGETIVQQ